MCAHRGTGVRIALTGMKSPTAPVCSRHGCRSRRTVSSAGPSPAGTNVGRHMGSPITSLAVARLRRQSISADQDEFRVGSSISVVCMEIVSVVLVLLAFVCVVVL